MVHLGTRMALGASVFVALIAFAAPSSAAESIQKQCGDEWAAAKKAGSVPAGQAWPGFLSECKKRKAAGGAATPATATAAEKKTEKKEKAAEKKAEKAAEKKADKAAEKKADKTPPAVAPTAAAAPKSAAPTKSADINETCKSEYSAGKAAGSVPKGTNYFKYLSDCKKRHAGDSAPATKTTEAPVAKPTAAPTTPATAPAVPPKSTATTTPATTPAAKTTGATAAPSGGREAFIERERTCGAKWKTIKGTSALPAGVTTWPKYLSYCNARLKAGQPI